MNYGMGCCRERRYVTLCFGFFVAGASYIYQTTQFPDSSTKYHNYYLLLRVEAYFGACSHVPEQLGIYAGEDLSARPLKAAILTHTCRSELQRWVPILAQCIPMKGNSVIL